MTTDAAASATPASRRTSPTWAVATVAALFGLFYAFAIWQALGNLIASVDVAEQIGATLNGIGWLIWILAIAFPALIFGAALAIGLRRGILTLALVLLTGLGLVAVFWLNVVAYTSLNTSAILS